MPETGKPNQTGERFRMMEPKEPNTMPPGSENWPVRESVSLPDRVEKALLAIGTLAEPVRELVVLHYVHRLTHNQIAERLHLTPEGVRDQLNEALAQLRRELAPAS